MDDRRFANPQEVGVGVRRGHAGGAKGDASQRERNATLKTWRSPRESLGYTAIAAAAK
jgi:hypothetical protein